MRLSTRLTLVMVALVLLTALAGALLTRRDIESALLPAELARIESHARLLAGRLDDYVQGARADTEMLRHVSALEGLVRAHAAGGADPQSGLSEAVWREQLASLCFELLCAKPEYLKVRVIGVADGGREIVRADRSLPGGPGRLVPGAELQQKGERPFFQEGLRLASGEMLVTPVELNQENGVIEMPPVPVLRTEMAIHTASGEPFGIVIINVDMRPAFAQMQAPAASGGRVYVVSEQGDYLLHSDASREFASELGGSARWTGDFPQLAGLFSAGPGALQSEQRDGEEPRGVVALTTTLAGGPRVGIIESRPLSSALATAQSIRRSSLFAGLGSALLAIVLAVILARSISRPVSRMTDAVQAFARGEPGHAPTRAGGEIGVLANAFERMAGERRDAEEQFRLAVESCPSGMIMVDAEGRMVLVNGEAERLFGYTRAELLGQPVDMLVPRAARSGHPQQRQTYTANPGRRAMGAGRDLHGLRKDGSEFPVEIGLNPIDTPAGMRVLSVIVDITERKRHEETLAAQTRDLQRSNADLEQFAYVASHDLQEPLRMVASYTQLLGERYRGQLDDRADKYIGYAVEGAKRMQQLVNDLLAYSRVGTQGKELRPVEMGTVLRHVLAVMRARLDENGGQVIADSLPLVMADEVQLGQLFQNLIGNALKFRSEAPPEICITARRDGSHWVLTVADNGIGVEKQYCEKIFQMFQRLHERGRYEGNGIGLAIAKKIVERHGGQIWCDSEPGRGTSFHFTIPAAPGGE